MGRKLITARCEKCGAEFQRRRTLPPGQGRFCSLACSTEWFAAQHREERICRICGKTFTLRRSYPKETCSRECTLAYRKQLANTTKRLETIAAVGRRNKGRASPRKPPARKTCRQCGKSFTLDSGLTLAVRQHRAFCSTACWYEFLRADPARHPSWRGGYFPYYGPDWPQQSRLARERDGHRCQRCGVAESELNTRLDVHHIRPRRAFADQKAANRLDNLICLCKRCHSIVENPAA